MKMLTMAGILAGEIHLSDSKQRILYFQCFSFYEQLKIHAHLS